MKPNVEINFILHTLIFQFLFYYPTLYRIKYYSLYLRMKNKNVQRIVSNMDLISLMAHVNTQYMVERL